MKAIDINTLLLAITAGVFGSATAFAQTPAATVTAPTSDSVIVSSSGGTGADWALKQDEIKNDPLGQWAASATASSTYNDATGQTRFAAWQATGAPNVDREGDNGNAWAPKTADGGIEWVTLGFSKPVKATGIRIRESAGAGSIIKVALIDSQGTEHALWSGKDPTTGLNYFTLTFTKTDYTVDHVKITLATNVVPGWNEIDAVQLLGSDN